MVSLVQSSPSAVVNASSGAAIAENTNPSAVVGQLRLTPQAVDDIVAQAAVIAKADTFTQQQHALASMGFNHDDIKDMLDLAAEAQTQGVGLDKHPTLKRIADEMASRLHALAVIDKHKQDANPELFAEVSRGLKQETLQATLGELDRLAAELGYEIDDEPVLVDKAVREKESVQNSLSDGLLAYYSFNHGDARNDLGNEYDDGVLHNGVSLVSGVLGTAYQFDGIDDRVKLDHRLIDNLDSFSISFWINAENSKLEPTIFSGATHSGNHHDDNEFLLALSKGTGYERLLDIWMYRTRVIHTRLSKFIRDEQWHHMALTRTPVEISFYVDGVLNFLAHHDLPGASTIDHNGFWLGGDQDCLGGCWNVTQQYTGRLDELLFFNRELTPSEVLFLGDVSNFDATNPWWLASNTATPSPPPTPECDKECAETWVNIAVGVASLVGTLAGAAAACGFFRREPRVVNVVATRVDENPNKFTPL